MTIKLKSGEPGDLQDHVATMSNACDRTPSEDRVPSQAGPDRRQAVRGIIGPG